MSDRTTLDVYAEKAADYEALGISDTQVQALNGFLARLPAAARILDIGCGPGLHAEYMATRGHKVIGIDPTEAFVQAARSRGIDARLGGFDDIAEVATYDGIWASFCLLHARRADLPRHIAAMARALTPGGTLFIGMKTGVGERRDRLGRFYTYVTDEELTGLVEAVGLIISTRVTGAETGLDGSVAPFILMTAHA